MPIRERIGRFKYTTMDKVQSEYDNIMMELEKSIDNAIKLSKE